MTSTITSSISLTDNLPTVWVATIVSAAQAGQQSEAEHAWSQLYDYAVQRVYRMVCRFVHEDGVAQEVTEDVMFLAWTQAQRFDPSRGTVMTWLLTMARSRAIDAWRKHSAQVVSFNSDTADAALAYAVEPVDLISTMQTRHAVHTALLSIAPDARQMISLAFFQGLTHSEISAHTQTPIGTVKTTIRRALLSLREHLQHSSTIDMSAQLLLEE